MKAIIITGGKIHRDHALGFIKENTGKASLSGGTGPDNAGAVVIAVEKGLLFCMENGIVPALTVGDFDSIGEEYALKASASGIETLKVPSEKDETDTQLAIRTAVERGCSEIIILGGTGYRGDHTFANICAMAEAVQRTGADIRMTDPLNSYRIRTESYTILKKEAFGKYISFFALGGPVKGLTLKGFRYGLENYDLDGTSPLCTSNEQEDEKAYVSFDSGILLEIMSRDNDPGAL